MKHIVALIINIFLLTGPLSAQLRPDSVRVMQANWHTTKIVRKLVWREVHLDTLFGAKQNINVLVIKNRGRKPGLTFGSGADSLKPTSWFGRRAGARGALNGTFFDIKKGGSVDYIKIDGRVFDTTRIADAKAPVPEHQQAGIVIDHNRVGIVFGGDRRGWERDRPEPSLMTTGPLLLQNGQRHPLRQNPFNNNRHPRTALGLGSRRQLLLVTVDGRNANAAGMSLPELTDLLRWLGCRDAINLDGGGSTTLWLRNQPGNGVVNYPSDSKQWIHTGERPVSNVILVR
jgi:exopolysaccharide biosynthesis protein